MLSAYKKTGVVLGLGGNAVVGCQASPALRNGTARPTAPGVQTAPLPGPEALHFHRGLPWLISKHVF